MDYFWRCACGDEAVNTPDGEGLRTVRRHRMRMAAAGEKGHYVAGLFDEDGNCVISGDDPKTAVELGLMDQVPQPVRPYKPKDKEAKEKTTSAKEPGAVKSPSNLQGIITGMRIALPPSTWGWLSLGFRYLRKDDGAPFTWAPEDVSAYIAEVISFWHTEHLHQILGMDAADARLAEVIRAIRDMDLGPPAPPVTVEGGVPDGV